MALQGQARNPGTQAKPLIYRVSVLGFRARGAIPGTARQGRPPGDAPRNDYIPAFFRTMLTKRPSPDGFIYFIRGGLPSGSSIDLITAT